MPKHAYLSASTAPRWTICTPSAKLCSGVDDRASPYAKEGTDCHELCAYLVEKALGRDTEDPTESLEFYNAEMRQCAEEYRNFVIEEIEEAKKHCTDPVVFVEQRLDFSKWVPDGFGTGDCVIVADELLQVIDFKYGLGVLVEAEMNAQMLCYALGAIDLFDGLYDITTVRMTIFQPRRNNIDTFTMSKDELLTWAQEVLKPAAALAYEGKGNYQAGDHCRFCKVKAECRARAELNMELAKYEFRDPPFLSEAEIADILERADGLVSWANDVKAYALQQALSGKRYEGWKVVEGRSIRKIADEKGAADAVIDAGYDPYEKRLLGITELSRMLGKARFEEILGGFITKPPGKPALVPVTDKRPEMNTAAEDFKNT